MCTWRRSNRATPQRRSDSRICSGPFEPGETQTLSAEKSAFGWPSFAEAVPDDFLRGPVHGRGVDQPPALREERPHDLGALVPRRGVLADVERRPAPQADERQRLAGRGDRARDQRPATRGRRTGIRARARGTESRRRARDRDRRERGEEGAAGKRVAWAHGSLRFNPSNAEAISRHSARALGRSSRGAMARRGRGQAPPYDAARGCSAGWDPALGPQGGGPLYRESRTSPAPTPPPRSSPSPERTRSSGSAAS